MMKYDVVIIGSGVAGLTAGLYASRANCKVLIVENSNLGGVVSSLGKLENYPGFKEILGFELIQNIYMQAVSFGTSIEFCDIKSIDFDNNIIYFSNFDDVTYSSLIVANGSSYRKLNISEPDKFKNKGVSYCAVCDGNLYRNKSVVVVTNGFLGKETIEYLSNITDKIQVLDLSDKYSSDVYDVKANVAIEELIGDDYVTAIKYSKNGEIFTINCDGVFVSLGRETDNSLIKDSITLQNNSIVTDETMKTNISNVFAAGDIRAKQLKQVVTACADGAIAGTNAAKLAIKNKN